MDIAPNRHTLLHHEPPSRTATSGPSGTKNEQRVSQRTTLETQQVVQTSSAKSDQKNVLRKLPSLFHSHRLTKKSLLLGSALLIASCLTVSLLIARNATNINQATESDKTPLENLEYQTIVPEGKAIGELGGWKRVSPPESDPVYAFNDVIGDVPISVSQQPIPGPFIGDLDNRVTKLAKEYNATTLIYADETKVYIGTSSKGPQSTIFTKNNLLILIKSQKKIEDQAWIDYIKALN